MPLFLVLSGNSQVGAAAAHELLATGAEVRIGVRDIHKAMKLANAGAEVVAADLNHFESLPPALDEVDAVVLATSADPEIHVLHHRLYDAARAAGVEHIVRISVLGASVTSPIELGRTHGLADDALKESGMAWTIFQPHMFTQNLLALAGMIRKGQIFGASGSGRIPQIDVRDIGACAAAALTKGGHEGKTYVLTGSEALTMDEVAAIFSEVLNRKVEYVNIPGEAYQAGMLAAGFPAWLAADLTWLATNVHASGSAAHVTDAVEQITGHKARTVRQFIEEHRSAF